VAGIISVASISEDDVAEHRAQPGQRVGRRHVEDQLEGQRAEGVVQGVDQQPTEADPAPRGGVATRVQVRRDEGRRHLDRLLGRLETVAEQEIQRPDEDQREDHHDQGQHHAVGNPVPVQLGGRDQRSVCRVSHR
jgi:hypothetical protein